jgi:isoleucyl-tRNA synthetase
MYDFKKVEEEIFDFWKDKEILKRTRKALKGKKKFYFLDGPPYTSGRIHMGTAWNQVLKDQILRYKRMNDFDVWDRGGYDMHGLPTAHNIQKKHNLKDKEDIEKFGVGKFVKECEEFSLEMMGQMNKEFDRLAVTLDHENPYMPITPEYIEGEWWLIKKAHENKRLYLGKKVMTWCAQCETALAKHELEYENVKDESIFVKFKVEDKENEYLIIWTTTPWTIAYNLGVMVNPKLDYVKVQVGKEVWILAKELVEEVMNKTGQEKFKILEEFKGKDLKGTRYVHPFYDELKNVYDDIKKKSKAAFSVVLSEEFVNLSAGTGLVHMAPGCGPEDYEIGRQNKIPAFNNLTQQGNYPKEMGKFKDLNAKEDNYKFIKALDEVGNLVGKEKIVHDYAHCWRCHKPIIFRTTNQWFFKVEDLVPKMLKQSEEIFYVPKEIKDRYQLWIKNLKDNSVTRQRYWGAPFPVWKCDSCEKYTVVGSVKELKELTGKVPENLHRPWIDELTIKCECGKQQKRIPDIIDVWVDSGVASWNCLNFPKSEEDFKRFWPADLVLEATEQTRLWFYMLQLVSNISRGKNCFKAMYAHGMLRDYKGVKMSKSIGNIISPKEVLDKYGVDTLRLYTTNNTAGEDMSFSWEEIKLKYRELNVLLNVTNYLLNYCDKLDKKIPSKLESEDKWILSRLNSTINQTTENMDKFYLDKAPKLVEDLFLDLSRRYIQLTRDRTNEKEVFEVIFEVLINSLKMLSITCPYITEHLYQKLKEKYDLKEESIHMCKWPKADSKLIKKPLESDFEHVFMIIEKGLAERDREKVGLKWPLPLVTISYSKPIDKKCLEIIKKQLNVKEIKNIVSKDETPKIELDTKLTPELESEGYAREMSRKVQAFRKKLGLNIKDLVETSIITDDKFKKILDSQIDFLKERTNSKTIEIVTTGKERFKNKIDFKIKDQKGEIGIITTN